MKEKFAKLDNNNNVIDIKYERVDASYHPVSAHVRVGWYYDDLDKGWHPPVAPEGFVYDWESGGFYTLDYNVKLENEKELKRIEEKEMFVAEKYIDKLLEELINKGVI